MINETIELDFPVYLISSNLYPELELGEYEGKVENERLMLVPI